MNTCFWTDLRPAPDSRDSLLVLGDEVLQGTLVELRVFGVYWIEIGGATLLEATGRTGRTDQAAGALLPMPSAVSLCSSDYCQGIKACLEVAIYRRRRGGVVRGCLVLNKRKHRFFGLGILTASSLPQATKKRFHPSSPCSFPYARKVPTVSSKHA